MAILWTWPEYDNDTSSTFLYYLVAIPMHILPVMARSWRIYCIYRPTPNWRFKMETNFHPSPKRRGHSWMFVRMAWWMTPWWMGALLTLYDDTSNLSYYYYIGLEGIFLFFNVTINWKLYTIRGELRHKSLDETKSLLMYSILCILEWMWSNTVYLTVQESKKHLIPVWIYIYVDLFLIFFMWLLTGGRALYKVWVEGHAVDVSSTTNCAELKYAKKAPSVQVLSVICSDSLEISPGQSMYTH
jgi:hypothetical protein